MLTINDLPIDIKKTIWNMVITNYRLEHKKLFGSDLNRVPMLFANMIFEKKMNNCLNTEWDFIQYRTIRDYIQMLADTRKIKVLFATYCHDIYYCLCTNFQYRYSNENILVSSVWENDLYAPNQQLSLYGDDSDQIPRQEIPPIDPNKEQVHIWIDCRLCGYYKFAINIDRDLIHYFDD